MLELMQNQWDGALGVLGQFQPLPAATPGSNGAIVEDPMLQQSDMHGAKLQPIQTPR